MDDDDGLFYQIVCSAGPMVWKDAVGWLSEQVGYEFPTGEFIEHIDQFQFILIEKRDWAGDQIYNVVATCSVYQPAQAR